MPKKIDPCKKIKIETINDHSIKHPPGIFNSGQQLKAIYQYAQVLEMCYDVKAPVILARDEDERIVAACFFYFYKKGGAKATLYVPRFGCFAPNGQSEKLLFSELKSFAKSLGIAKSVISYNNSNMDEYFCWSSPFLTCAPNLQHPLQLAQSNRNQ